MTQLFKIQSCFEGVENCRALEQRNLIELFFSSWPKHWLSNFHILQPMKGPCRNVLLRFRKFPNALETFKIFTCAKYPDIFSTDCTIIKKAFSPHSALRSLSKDDDDGSENVSKNMNSRRFKLYRAYLDPLNVGDFSWS